MSFTPIEPIVSGGGDDVALREAHLKLPAGWTAERAMWRAVAKAMDFEEHNIAAGRDLVIQMRGAGLLEHRVVKARVEYRAAEPAEGL